MATTLENSMQTFQQGGFVICATLTNVTIPTDKAVCTLAGVAIVDECTGAVHTGIAGTVIGWRTRIGGK